MPTGLWLIIVGAVVLAIIIYSIIIYNRLVYLRNEADEAFKAVDTYLEQRFDTITKLAQTVASYARHEEKTYERVSAMRSGYKSMSPNEKIRASNEMDQLFRGLNIQVESYPEIKANENYMHLQRTINEIEEYLSASRRTFNAHCNDYNTYIQKFPTNIDAKVFGFKTRDMLAAPENKKVDPDMQSLLGGIKDVPESANDYPKTLR